MTEHHHPEYWTVRDHDRYENRISAELRDLRDELDVIGTRLSLMMGGIAVLAVILNLFGPVIQQWIGAPGA